MKHLASALLMLVFCNPILTAQESTSGLTTYENMKVVLVTKLPDGSEKTVEPTWGPFKTEVNESLVSHTGVVGLLTGPQLMNDFIMGESSEFIVSKNISKIKTIGYSLKYMGIYGDIALVKTEVMKGNRYIQTEFQNRKIAKKFLKLMEKDVRFSRNPDGAWELDIIHPLEPGHYIVCGTSNAAGGEGGGYWDFDVKEGIETINNQHLTTESNGSTSIGTSTKQPDSQLSETQISVPFAKVMNPAFAGDYLNKTVKTVVQFIEAGPSENYIWGNIPPQVMANKVAFRVVAPGSDEPTGFGRVPPHVFIAKSISDVIFDFNKRDTLTLTGHPVMGTKYGFTQVIFVAYSISKNDPAAVK